MNRVIDNGRNQERGGAKTMRKSEPTVHQWANAICRRFREDYGEKAFARLISHFADQIPRGIETDNHFEVMRILVETNNSKSLQLAIIWLDRAGYGESSAGSLFNEIYSIRIFERNLKQKGQRPVQARARH
jgi:hypothetical protein